MTMIHAYLTKRLVAEESSSIRSVEQPTSSASWMFVAMDLGA